MTTDTRTFVEIWNSLTPSQQEELQVRIIRDAETNSTTFWFWKAGKSRPGTPLARKTVAGTVSRYLRTPVKPEFLFPKK